MANETVQYHTIETVLEKYKALQTRLGDVESEAGDGVTELESIDSAVGRIWSADSHEHDELVSMVKEWRSAGSAD